jgi:hypothetical protein
MQTAAEHGADAGPQLAVLERLAFPSIVWPHLGYPGCLSGAVNSLSRRVPAGAALRRLRDRPSRRNFL